jgi:DNA polymerase
MLCRRGYRGERGARGWVQASAPDPAASARARYRAQELGAVKRHLHFDFETRSKADIKLGTDYYSRHSSTQIILAAWAIDDGPVQQYDYSDPDFSTPLQELFDLVLAPDVQCWAHNAQFERAILKNVCGIETPIEKYRCTMALAYMLGLPGALADLGTVLKLPDEFAKQQGGKNLINVFCKPRTGKKVHGLFWSPEERPEEWAQFRHYNRRDVEAERFVWEERLSKYPVLDREWEEWFTDQRINERGVPIDRQFVANARVMVDTEMERLRQRLSGITGLDNPNSDTQFGPWVRDRGYAFGDMRKQSVATALEDVLITDEAREALLIRAQLKRTSVAKYIAIDDRMVEDDRLRYLFQFSGASRTGRSAGRGPQFQNLAKPQKRFEKHFETIIDLVHAGDYETLELEFGDVMSALSGVIRGSVRATVRNILHVCDLAAIESRVVAWLAGCDSLLAVFRQGLDVYKAFGTRMFGIPYEEITKDQRTLSKPAVLGCGFRLSGGALVLDQKTGDIKKTGLWGYAANMGIEMTQEQAIESVRVFRESYPEIVEFWYALENAAKQVITGSAKEVMVGKLKFDRLDPFMRIELPSGRRLHYLRPKMELRTIKLPPKNPGEEPPPPKQKWMMTFEGMEDDGTHKVWGRQATHGGKLAENVTQAVANDILRCGLTNAELAGFETILHAHDEIVTETPYDSRLSLARLREAMIDKPEWAEDLPLDAAGFSTYYYRKD